MLLPQGGYGHNAAFINRLHYRAAGMKKALGVFHRNSSVSGFYVLELIEKQRCQQTVKGHIAATGNDGRTHVCSDFKLFQSVLSA